MPSWLKGGVIGLLAGILIIIIEFILLATCYDNCLISLSWFYFPFRLGYDIFSWILFFITYIVIGSIIGLIIGKIKLLKYKK